MSSVRFDLNPNLSDELEALPGTKRVKRDTAKAITERAKIAAPVGASLHYRGTLRWVSRDDVTAAATNDIAGHIVEWGSINNPAYAPLRGAVRSLGIRFTAAPH